MTNADIALEVPIYTDIDDKYYTNPMIMTIYTIFQ